MSAWRWRKRREARGSTIPRYLESPSVWNFFHILPLRLSAFQEAETSPLASFFFQALALCFNQSSARTSLDATTPWPIALVCDGGVHCLDSLRTVQRASRSGLAQGEDESTEVHDLPFFGVGGSQ